MPNKPQKWGMKAWFLADSTTGYTWNWKLYAGKDSDTDKSTNLAHSVVVQLTKDLADKGYNVHRVPDYFCSFIKWELEHVEQHELTDEDFQNIFKL